MWLTRREFDSHVSACDRRYKEMADASDERHHENTSAIAGINTLLWRTAFGVIATLLAGIGALALNIVKTLHG